MTTPIDPGNTSALAKIAFNQKRDWSIKADGGHTKHTPGT